MPLPKEHICTIDDIYALPDGARAELIDGQIYNMAPPSRIHQRISGLLHLPFSSTETILFMKIFILILKKFNKNMAPREIEDSWGAIFLIIL